MDVDKRGLVSIIMPCLDSSSYISESIQSILNQSYRNFELLIIDNGSQDGTLDIIKSFRDERIELLLCDQKGVSFARNMGIKNSKGNYIAFCDSDDTWMPEKLEKQIKIFSSNSCSIVTANAVIIDSYGNSVGKRVFERMAYKSDMLIQNRIVNSSAVILRNKIISFQKPIYHEDYDFWLSNLSNSDLILNTETFEVNYRLHNNNLSKNKIKGIIAWWRIHKLHGIDNLTICFLFIGQLYSRLKYYVKK